MFPADGTAKPRNWQPTCMPSHCKGYCDFLNTVQNLSILTTCEGVMTSEEAGRDIWTDPPTKNIGSLLLFSEMVQAKGQRPA